MRSSLIFLAGRKARARIEREGLSPDAVKVVAGAAGGPKWLVLSQLDRFLFGEFLATRQAPLFLLGSSIGTWRFAAASQRDPLAAISRFEDAYIAQAYRRKPSPREVSDTSLRILETMLGGNEAEILQHPTHRLGILTGRSSRLVASDNKVSLLFGLGIAALVNLASREQLRHFFSRTLFHDSRARPPYLDNHGFDLEHVALLPANLKAALLASGSIPLIMAGVDGIPGAQAGIYRDGGVVDYHLDVPFLAPTSDEIVLFPHFGPKIVPGWLDKSLPWRKPTQERMDHVLLIAPSPELVERLPGGKIPDRRDFYLYQGRDAARMEAWRGVLRECARMTDDLAEVLRTGQLPAVLQDL